MNKELQSEIYIALDFFLTLSDPGYYKPLIHHHTISKTVLSIFILPGVSHMFQLDFFLNSRPFYVDFKIKSSENSCKNNICIMNYLYQNGITFCVHKYSYRIKMIISNNNSRN